MGANDFLGSEILAKSNFLGSMKDVGDFFALLKQKLRDFLGYAKKSSDFLGKQILKL